ncbi:hypothetical protein [Streptomyces lavendulae]|uniref:hypothetical protein n=1 Tax=Streptomyces lavendulae TaxID=1914 RepID=UPI0024A371D8|nr:hypothetical protein [Streptomyces lavendulae]GLX16884.1 hypothetical protein Slala01_05280 [Streptomyces lavendulae subsp. lavendulae]GLX25506.1 hypothetical protein Slala02_13260 [Streptomyces lavendulae subsp. lavendulae]
MPSRRMLPPSLSLLLAVLVTATGCVTVRAPDRAPGPAPDRTAEAPRQPVVENLPLGPAPDPVEVPAPPVGAAAPAPPSAQAPPPAAPDRPAPRSDDRPPRRASADRPARPARRAPAPAPKPRKRQPARPAPRPAPQRSYDMRHLCEAAHGVVDPAIVAMCR